MAKHPNDRLQGTLDLMVLKSLASQGAMHGYAISVYPDSDTVGVWAGDEDQHVFVRGTAVPWAHGEEG